MPVPPALYPGNAVDASAPRFANFDPGATTDLGFGVQLKAMESPTSARPC